MRRLPALLCLTLLFSPACDKTQPDEDPTQQPEYLNKRVNEGRNILYSDRGDRIESATASFAEVLQKQPGHPGATLGMALVRVEEKNWPDAQTLLTQVIAADAKNPEAHATMGKVQIQQQQFAGAIESYKTAAQLDPNETIYPMRQGVAMVGNKQYDEAITLMEGVAKEDPKLQYIYREIGEAYRLKGEPKLALKSYMRSLNEQRGDRDAYYGASLAYEAMGEHSKSLDMLSEYKRRDCCSTFAKTVVEPKLKKMQLEEQERLNAKEK